MGKGSSTTTSQTSANPQAVKEANNAYNTAASAATAPYQYYPGQLVAPLNANQNQAISTVANANGIANPYINAASDLTGAATEPIGASQINQFMNPYISDTVNTTANEINQNNQIQQTGLQGNAAALGALGGNRVGMAQAALANQQDMAENATLAGLYSSGYNSAVTNAQTQNSQDLQGAYEYGNLGTTAQNTALTGANAQIETGGIQQQQQQNQLNQTYSQWEGAQQYPFQTGEYLTNTAASLAPLYGGQSSTTTPAPSTFSQVVGGLGSVAGIAGQLKRGGAVEGGMTLGDLIHYAHVGHAVHRALGGRTGYDVGGGLPPPPAPFDPNAGTDGSQKQQSSSSGGGGGNVAGLMKIASMFMKSGGRAEYDDGGWVIGHFGGPPPPPPVDPNAGTDGSKKHGGFVGYDSGGSIPYQTIDIPAQDFIGNSRHAGYIPQMSFEGAGHFGGPQAPQGYDPNQGTTNTNITHDQAAADAAGLDKIANWWTGMDNGIGDSMGDTNSDVSLVAHQGGERRGGRIQRAAGGSSTTQTASGGLGGLTPTLATATPTEGQQIENYQFLSPLIATGHVTPQAQQSQGNALAEEQSEEENIAAAARGGRLPRTAGGALPAFQPVGSVSGNAPQPTSTAATQPTSWGGVQMAAAPQLAAPQGAAPGTTGGLPSLGNAAAQFASTYTGSQDPYTAYIESLPGANPSGGNPAPSVAAPTAPTTTSKTPTSHTYDPKNIYGWLEGGTGKKAGGRLPRDLGGLAGNGDPDQSYTPAIAAPVTQTTLGDLTPAAGPASPGAPDIPGPSPTYAAKVAHVESGGNPAAQNPRSTASGPGQFLDSTFEGVASKIDPALVAGKTPAQIAAEKSNPAIANDMTTAYAQQNAQVLAANKLPVNDGTLYLAHNFGAEGATKLLTADPNAPASSVLSPLVLQENPDLVGKTVGRVVASRSADMGVQVAQNGASDAGAPAPLVAPGQSYGQGYPMSYPAMPGGDQGLAALQQRIDAQNYHVDLPQQTEVDKIANSPWTALAAAGLATLGGTSPFASVNIGQGALAGLGYLQSTEAQERANTAQRANIQSNNATIGQNALNQGLAAVGAGQTGAAQQVNAGDTVINAVPAMNAAQINTAQQDPGIIASGQPAIPYPQIPGLGGVGPAAAAAAAAPVPMPSQQPQAPVAPSAPVQNFGPQATGIPSAESVTVDTSVPTPQGNMPLAQAVQMAQHATMSPGAYGDAWRRWMTNMAPAMNQQGVTDLQNQAQTADVQNQTLTELADAAAQVHTGPITGPLQAKLYEGYEDLATAAGGNPDPSITAQSDAYQVIPKLATAIQISLNKLGSQTGGSEMMSLVGPAIPTVVNTTTGLQQLVRVYSAVNARAQALAQYVTTATQQGLMTYNQAGQAFNQKYPPQMWASRVMPLPMPSSADQLKPGYAYKNPNGDNAYIWSGSGWVSP